LQSSTNLSKIDIFYQEKVMTNKKMRHQITKAEPDGFGFGSSLKKID